MPVASLRLHIDTLPPSLSCPKCDQNVYQQHDGSTLTSDIAHQHETIAKALQKLDALLLEGWAGPYQQLRLIVGGGLIREQVLGQLYFYQQQGRLLRFKEDSPNRGAIVVSLRAVR
jgi:hypothetical protein